MTSNQPMTERQSLYLADLLRLAGIIDGYCEVIDADANAALPHPIPSDDYSRWARGTSPTPVWTRREASTNINALDD